MKLVTASGRELEVLRVVKGGLMDYLHIYINHLTIPEIYEIFNNRPDETNTITVIETRKDQQISHVYQGYTELYAINKPFLSSPEGTWMVWMQRPMETIEDISNVSLDIKEAGSTNEEVIPNAE